MVMPATLGQPKIGRADTGSLCRSTSWVAVSHQKHDVGSGLVVLFTLSPTAPYISCHNNPHGNDTAQLHPFFTTCSSSFVIIMVYYIRIRMLYGIDYQYNL